MAGKTPDKTVPSKKILDRDISAATTRDVRDVGRPALRELIDESVRAFERCSATATGKDEHVGLLFPFLHAVELLDAADLCLDGSSATGADLVLRAVFESLLAIEWIARDRDLRYARAYVVADIHRRIKAHQRTSEGHAERKAILAALASDPMSKDIQYPVSEDGPSKVAGFREMLAEPHLVEAETEYQRVRKLRKGKPPHFYTLWDGPKSLEQLARKLGRSGQYEILYRNWSLIQHSGDVARLLGSRDGSAAVRAFRSGDGLSTSYTFAIVFGLVALRTLLEFYRPGEFISAVPGRVESSYEKWYKAHISKALQRVAEAD